MAIKLADTARPNNHVDAEHLGTFPVAYAEDVWFSDGTRLSEKTFDGQSIQKKELPIASADELGNICQYVGINGTYINGFFYECVYSNGGYAWQEKQVSKAGAEFPIILEAETTLEHEISCLTFSEFPICLIHTVNDYGSNFMFYFSKDKNEDPKIITVGNRGKFDGYPRYDYSRNKLFISNGDKIRIEIISLNDGVTYEFTTVSMYSIESLPYLSITPYEGSSFNEADFSISDDNLVSLLPSQRIFTGTQAEWDALTTYKKKTYGQVNITDDESDPSIVVDAVTDGDMHAVTSNAVYDEFKKVQPQTYECYGFLVNSLAGEITGYGRATVILRDGIAEIKFSVRIHTNDGPGTFNWGLNRDLLHTLLPNLPVITPIGNNSNLQFFAGTGAVLVDLMGYGAMASSVNQFWVPARMYQIDGSTGTWSTDRFPINSYITGTVYGAYTV